MDKKLKKRIKNKLSALSVKYFERIWFIKWFNPIATLYINFRSFKISQAIRFPIFAYGCPRIFSLSGKMICADRCYPGMINFNKSITGAPGYTGGNSEINNWGTIIFHGHCDITTSNKIDTSTDGTIEFGEGVCIGASGSIGAYSKIYIGAQTRFAHRCQVLDSNYHFIADFTKGIVRKIANPIHIGDYCWICNSTTISGGANIPNKTIVASNSVVNKNFMDIPEESIIGGIPAKFIKTGVRRIRSATFEKKVFTYFSENPNSLEYHFDKDCNHNICDIDK